MTIAITVLLILWFCGSFLMTLALQGKPAWTTFGGERKAVHAPLGRFLICAFVVAFFMATLIPHCIFRLFGFRGFYNKRESAYTSQNPFVRTER